MVYRRSRGNIRKPRRRSTTRRRSVRKSYSRRPASNKRKVKKECHCPGELSPTAKFALAQLDPFEPRCLGAKIPDTNTMPSIANQDTDIVAIVNGASAGQLVAYAFLPSYGRAVLASTAGSSSVGWNGTWSDRSKFSNVTTSCEAIRPVAHAIRLSCPTAPTSTTGFVHVGIAVESRYSSNSTATSAPEFPTNVSQMSGLAHYKRFTLASLTQSPITCINKWIDETGFRYVDPRAAAAYTEGSTGSLAIYPELNFLTSWGTIIVMVEGSAGSSSTVLSAEHILLTEALPKKDAFILGTQAAPNSPGTMGATSTMVSEIDFAHTEAQQESYIQAGLQAFGEGAQSAGERVWSDVAAPLLQRFGNNVLNAGMMYAINAATGRGGIPGVNSNPARLTLT